MHFIVLYYLSLINFCLGFPRLVVKTLRTKLHSIQDNLIPEHFLQAWKINSKSKKPSRPKQPIAVHTLAKLHELIQQGYRVQDLDVRGNTTERVSSSSNSPIESHRIHPVVKALHERANQGSVPGQRTDKLKIAVALEGGGMRGCVGAGMITALWHLGLEDSVDVVYGSSAGSLIGAYFIARQLPHFGPEVYYDVLTSAGKEFIDSQAILRSVGLGLFDLRLKSLVELFTDRMGTPVLNLDYLLTTIVQTLRPLNWTEFHRKQEDGSQTLKVVASGLLSKRSVVMSYADGNFRSLSELAQCMRASMLLPGVTGDVARLKGSQAEGRNILRVWWREYRTRRNSSMVFGSEPLSDALIFEPVPYRSAVKDNCTHVLVFRTRPDGVSVTAKMGIVEKLIMSRFFGRKQGLPDLVHWMHRQYHKLVYAEDVLILNAENRNFDEPFPQISYPSLITTTPSSSSMRGHSSDRRASLYCVALPEGTSEVQRMETSREAIFNSVRAGFAAAYEALVDDPALKGKGWEVARQIWPDSLLDTPAHVAPKEEVSAPPSGPLPVYAHVRGGNVLPETPSELKAEKAVLGTTGNQLPVSKRKTLVRLLRQLQATILGVTNQPSDVSTSTGNSN